VPDPVSAEAAAVLALFSVLMVDTARS